MEKLQISIASLVFAGGVAVGVVSMKITPTNAPVMFEQVIKTDVLKAATKECLDRVKTVDRDCAAPIAADCKPDTERGIDCQCAPDCQMATVIDGSKCSHPHIVSTLEQVPELDKDGKETRKILDKPTQHVEPGDCKNAEVTGWQCNGAFMARAEQDCLNEAMKAEVKEPVAEPIVEKLEP